MHGVSNRNTHLCPPHNSSFHLTITTTCVRRIGRPPMEGGVVAQSYETPYFQHRHRNPGMTLPRTAWVRFNHHRTGVRRFRSCLHKWGMASSAEEQADEHVVHQCPIHQPPHGLHGLTVLDDETIE